VTVLRSHGVKVLGHRGFAGRYPENSLLAFRKAVQVGADGVELDLRQTADGHVVVIHDATLDRTTTGQGVVQELTLRQIQQFRLRSVTDGDDSIHENLTVPTFEQVLDVLKGTGLYLRVEIKQSGIEDKAVRMIHAAGIKPFCWISSFQIPVLEAVKQADPSLPVVWISLAFEQHSYHQVRSLVAGVDFCLGPVLRPDHVRQVKADGLSVGFWTINDKTQLDCTLRLGADCIISDAPDSILKHLGRQVGADFR